MLHGRENELAFLEKQYQESGSRLVALYGKRRTGKTELLKRFCENKDHAFYVCRETTDTEQIRLFSKKILENSPLGTYIETFENWEKAFSFLMEESGKNKSLLVIDEFPYLLQSNSAVPSILQNLWDEKSDNSQLMLILTGSSMQTMKNQVLGSESPLFGRTDGILQVDELSFFSSLSYLGNSGLDQLKTWATLGGIPRYLNKFSGQNSFETNMLENVLSKGCSLYNEAEFLMKYELREPATYFTILEALANENRKIGDISKKTGLDRTKINVYLKNLMAMDVVRRIFPISLEPENPPGPHSSIYGFSNNYLRFYFRFIYPNFSALEENETEKVWEQQIEPYLPDFWKESFTSAAREILNAENRKGNLPFEFRECGAYWDKNTALELVATDYQNSLLSVLVHTDSQPADLKQLEKLRDKTALLKMSEHNKHYVIFSLSGFDRKLTELSRLDHSVLLYNFGIENNLGG